MAEAQDHIFHTIQAKEGWLVQLALRLSQMSEIELVVASRTNGLKQEMDFVINNIHHYCFPAHYTNTEDEMEKYWRRIYDAVKPDIVHIHGTECAHSASFVKAVPEGKTVVSIQGLASVIARYYYGGIPENELDRFTTIYNRYKGCTIHKSYLRMVEMGEREKYILSHVKYVLGRTEWDKTHVIGINSNITYFVGNETMRSSFYSDRWSLEKCQPHSIFITQGCAPYKGFHKMLEALAIIKRFFPDVKLKVALLPNILKPFSWKEKLTAGEYGRFMRKLINDLNVGNNIEVLGQLNEQEMVKTMLISNVFVSPSAIENSPNSLCEAQLLGMPAIASYVGGTPTIAGNGHLTELYRYEEIEMLAAKIMKIFNQGPDWNKIENARNVALERHDCDNNIKELIKTYSFIIDAE